MRTRSPSGGSGSLRFPAFLFSDSLAAELCSCWVEKLDSGEAVCSHRADVKNSWMMAGCDATWRFPFCLEATSQAVVEVERGGGLSHRAPSPPLLPRTSG